MSPPLLGMEGEGQRNVSLLASSISLDCKSRNVLGSMKDCTYLSLCDSSSSSIDGPVKQTLIKESKGSLNLKATELRLGLPGSESQDLNLLNSEMPDEKQLFPLLPSKDGIYSSSATRNFVSGNKRVFSDTIKEFSPVINSTPGERNWMFTNGVSNSETSQSVKTGMECLSKATMEQLPAMANGSSHNKINQSNSGSAPAAKAQVVGWPPVRSFRKNTLATTSKNNDEAGEKQSTTALFVKVSMDGAPYLRKVDLRNYSTYQELSSALEKMFSYFNFGKSGAKEGLGNEGKLRASLDGSEYVLTFEDKDGDWMLVGDVPWEMFIESCKRLKIMKGSDAIGLGPRATGEVED